MAKKKKFLVMPRTKSIVESGLKTGKGTIGFGDKTAMYVDDPGLAHEIDTEHGLHGSGEVWVSEDERLTSHMRDDDGSTIHHYHWGSTRKYRDGYDKIFSKKAKRRSDKLEVLDESEEEEENAKRPTHDAKRKNDGRKAKEI